MALFSRKSIPLITAVAIASIVTALVLLRPSDPPPPTPPPPSTSDLPQPPLVDADPQTPLPQKPTQPPVLEPPPEPEPPRSDAGAMLSVLAELPNWEALEVYQETITRSDFERLLTDIFTIGEAWRGYITIGDTEAHIKTGRPEPESVFVLRFSGREPRTLPREWQPTHQLPPAPADKPLTGLHIAIDPGHIGGEWARMEERWLVYRGGHPVCEGDMTLYVAHLLRPQLEVLGARVSMVRDTPDPVTPLRPDSLSSTAQDAHEPEDSPASLRRFAERLFYRTAEIRARARLVNQTFKPDLVLCLHFNAEAWGNARDPKLVDKSHLHLLLNGGYNDDEVILDDQRFALLAKLLQRTHEEEAFVGSSVADVFAQISGLPPFQYHTDSRVARPVDNHSYLWARNLLANRLYDCPVIYMEPYVMNSVTDFARIQAGDYEGLREVAGEMRPSIFREYAAAMAAGLLHHYTTHRALAD